MITGILFTDPKEGEQPSHDDSEKEFTAEDIAKGVFFPKAGRRYNKADLDVNNQGTQGVYWLSEAITGDGATEPCYGSGALHPVRRDQIPLLEQGIRRKSRILYPTRLYQEVMRKALLFVSLLLPAVVLTAGCGGGKVKAGKPLPAWSEGYLDIHAINTARGECTFFILPDGTTLTVDAGEFSSESGKYRNMPQKPDSLTRPTRTYARYMRHFMPYKDSLDYFLLTHFHMDISDSWNQGVTVVRPTGVTY